MLLFFLLSPDHELFLKNDMLSFLKICYVKKELKKSNMKSYMLKSRSLIVDSHFESLIHHAQVRPQLQYIHQLYSGSD